MFSIKMKLLTTITTILSTMIHSVFGHKIKERFRKLPDGFTLKLVISGSSSSQMSSEMDRASGLDMLTKGLNVTLVHCSQQKIGEVINITTQAYDGWIGFIQRNEANLMPQFVRPDSTPFEPGQFLTFSALDDSPRIYSVRSNVTEVVVTDILYLWTNFEDDLWFYFVISLILSSVLFIIFKLIFYSKMSMFDIISDFFESFWNYYLLSIDMAPTTILALKSAIILWTSIVLTIFYAVHIVLMGTLSTDLTVPITSRSIETLSDLLYDPEFRHVDPFIFRTLNMYSVLKSSREGTDERVLFERLEAKEDQLIVTIDSRRQQEFQRIISRVLSDAESGKIAVIENSEMVTPVMSYGACYWNATRVSGVKPSEDVIAQSLLCGLMSIGSPDGAVDIIQHRLMMISEMALMKGSLKAETKPLISSLLGFPITTEGIICQERFQHEYVDDLDLPWEIFDLQPFKRLLRILFGWMLCAALILFTEIVYFCHRNEKIKQPRSKIRKVTRWWL